MALLLDRSRLGIAPGRDQPAEYSPILARNFAPYWFALMLTEWNAAIEFGFREKNSPSVIRHLHVSKCRPALRVGRSRRPQIDIGTLKTLRPHLTPPLKEAGLPGLQRSLQAAVIGETHIVGNSFGIIDLH